MSAIRPEFEPVPEMPSVAASPLARTGLLPWLRLMRLPNVFTAIADVVMGYLFIHESVESAAQLACLIAASAALYTAGMVLNDVFDIAVDAKERPFRPLPSGKIRLPSARMLGFGLLLMGVAAGWAAGFLPGVHVRIPWRSGVVATLLAGCVVAYNAYLKSTPAGALAMGTCRFLNVLLGMSTGWVFAGSIATYAPPHLLAAAGIGLYIVGVTWFARREAGISGRAPLVAALVVMIAGIAMHGSSTALVGQIAMDQRMYWLLLALLLATVVRRCGVAVIDPEPVNVQAAVKHSILSLIWFDAATVAAIAGPYYGLAVAALLIPALLLGRWVYST